MEPINCVRISFEVDAVRELVKTRGIELAINSIAGDQLNKEYVTRVVKEIAE